MNKNQGLHRIVIVGGGAGGLELATRLGRTLGRKKQADILLIDARMTHIWKPLLHEVAAGSLNSYSDELNYLAQASWNHFRFQPGTMNGLNRKEKTITLASTTDTSNTPLLPERTIEYDTLVIAVGSHTNDFNTPGAQENCLFLDSREQAERIHQHLISRSMKITEQEDADTTTNIAIIGAGATGVELAAELHHAAQLMSRYGLKSDVGNTRITLLEGGNRVLPALPERISKGVQLQLDRIGIHTMTGTLVSQINKDNLETRDGKNIETDVTIWAAGIKGPQFLQNLDGLETNKINQLLVHPTLQTTQDDNIFSLGDCASCTITQKNGTSFTVPPRAQAAHQQASLLTKNIKRRLQQQELLSFEYRDHGSLISLSSHSAVGNLMGNLTGSVMLEGWLARMFYLSLYRLHQIALYGFWRTGMLMVKDLLERSTTPKLKLH
ncbi:NAD(P)/FAD-dependent oxidoreductase [Sansalvadorimonas sp. 2012CJ34-2]|uniref:NAD(P)/FAD-dependent oxidoreductase n=1 Tax=Parendozoicomonas callyspongiae TaxID=2942213 RepID=A0ABT0PC50_9GAMM|nr:NAD(P)/FAD-dependent oxidoreductase [Sansalvadorimonas sp. 2012CJ34-2]MCL6268954.1 NAD(P)/FAD-dependent oxidoreductase [Sansalvadorimonas sp. 2012CJ34-2]